MKRLSLFLVAASAVLVLGACVPKPPMIAAPAAPAAAAPAPAAWEGQLLDRVNAERAANGAPALVLCAGLARSASAHSADKDARNTMSHTGGDGSTLSVRANRAGYTGWTALGENVAFGYPDVGSVMAGWMGSPGHRANILNATYTHVGFGSVTSANGTPYWTQDFGRSGTC